MIHTRTTIDADVTPRFTASYLRIAGDEAAFIEAHTSHALPRLLAALAAQGKSPEAVRWIVITHAHLDHAAGTSALALACPNATVLAHPRSARHMVEPEKLIRGATAVYGEERFAKLYGSIFPIDKARVRALGDGESFDLGDAKLTVHFTEGHANHHFVIDDPTLQSVFTGDAFGLVYPALQERGRFAIPSTSPTGFDAALAQASLRQILAFGEKSVCLTHFDAYEDVDAIAWQIDRFLERAGQWVEEAIRGAESEADLIARFTRSWWQAIAEEAPHFGGDERKLLSLDVELNAQGLAFVANARRAELTKGPKQ